MPKSDKGTVGTHRPTCIMTTDSKRPEQTTSYKEKSDEKSPGVEGGGCGETSLNGYRVFLWIMNGL